MKGRGGGNEEETKPRAQLKQRHMAHEVCVVLFLFFKKDLGGFEKETRKKPRSSFFSFP